MSKIHPVRPIVYEDVIFNHWWRDDVDIYPWACICHQCSDDLLEGAGYGDPAVPSQCCVEGCTNTAQCFITLVDATFLDGTNEGLKYKEVV
jgi:hypothetical protein